MIAGVGNNFWMEKMCIYMYVHCSESLRYHNSNGNHVHVHTCAIECKIHVYTDGLQHTAELCRLHTSVKHVSCFETTSRRFVWPAAEGD